MSFKNIYNFNQLINESEEIVIEELEKQLAEKTNSKICKCEECILDMAAYALNKLPVAYRATYAGKLYTQQYHSGALRKKFEKTVQEAIEYISKNPSHE